MTRSNIQWTAKTLYNQMKKGNVNFDNAVQRSLVWDNDKKSLLIHSMVYGYAIPAMYFTKENGIYDSLDGKQRSNAIAGFLVDEYALSDNTPKVYDEDGAEYDISGMTFSQCPEWVQDKVKDYSLTIYFYEDMTEDEVREFFRRLNNGKPLSAVELTRVNTPSLAKFQKIAKHKAIQFVTTAAAKKRFTDENIAMQICNLILSDAPDFSTKAFREWAKSVEISEETANDVMTALNHMFYFISTLDTSDDQADKKLLKTIKARTHFVSAVYFCYYADKNCIDQIAINNKLREFFNGKPSISEEYNKTVGSGSAKPTAVQTRQKAMQNLAGGPIELEGE